MPWYPDILKDPEFREEISQEESPLSPAYPLAGKSLGPARVAGRLVRYAMEAPKELGRIWDRAKEGKATLGDSISAAMYGLAPSRGPGLGSGPRMRAAPWQSRTLDFVLGNPGPWKKPPEAASPQTWLSKAKGAGLPKEETQILTPFLESADPKSKLTGKQIAEGIEGKGPGTLPTLGVTKTELGGAEWSAGQKRLDKLKMEVYNARNIHQQAVRDNLPRFSEEFLSTKRNYENLLAEHIKLSEQMTGRGPKWPQFHLEGVENPREILYHAKSKEGGDYINSDMRMHFGEKGKNLAWFQQEGDLKMPDGKMSNHISGLQNDWAAEYAAKLKESKKFSVGAGIEDSDIAAVIGIRGSYNLSQLSSNEAQAARGRITFLHNVSGGQQATRQQIRWALHGDSGNPQMNADYNEYYSRFLESGRVGGVPEPPMKDTWWKTGLKDAVKRAVEEGKDYLSWDTAAIQSKRFPDPKEGTHKYFQQHYDENIPKFLAKEYGVKPEKVNIPSKVMGEVTIISPRGENINRPTTSLSMWRVKPEEAPGENLRWVIGDPDFGTYSHYGTYQEAKNTLDWLIRKGVETKNDEVWRIPITEEMKRKIVLEGQYFTKQTAKPGGRNAEMAA